MHEIAKPLPPFYDAHAHLIDRQCGGFVIGVEGLPVLPSALRNDELLPAIAGRSGFLAVPYVRASGGAGAATGPLAKYHPRREGFDAEWVSKDIDREARKLVLIDTLNAMRWAPTSYRDLAVTHPKCQFVFCHGGGYDILEFVKMVRFLRNVWMDFSATQHIFGWVGDEVRLSFVCDLVDHSMSEPRIATKLLFGSDIPGFAQPDAVAKVAAHPNADAFLRGNFDRLLGAAGL